MLKSRVSQSSRVLAKSSRRKTAKVALDAGIRSTSGTGTAATQSLAPAPATPSNRKSDTQAVRETLVSDKVRELLVIAKEQGHLTSDDIDEALVDSEVSPEILEQIYAKLNNLEVRIVDQDEADGVKQPEAFIHPALPENPHDRLMPDVDRIGDGGGERRHPDKCG